MTDDRLPLAELMQKAGGEDFLRSVAEAVVQLLMETDVDGVIGAGRHERSVERTTYRNGYRDRTLDTRLGSLQLRIPKLRQGSYFPPFLEPRKTTEKALVAVIQEAWIGGVSTRKVDELVQAMGLSGISKSTVSKLCKDIDDRVHAFLDRPLSGDWPYLWLDATYLKQREGGRIISVAAIIAVAVDSEGKREIVGLHIGPSEAETFWATFLKSLVRRGLRGVKLVISDAHEGLKAAIRRVMGATWQRCRVHWMRNALAYVPKSQQSMASASLRQAFLQDTPEKAHAGLARRCGPDAGEMAEARCVHGRQRARRAGLHGLPRAAPRQAAQHKPARALEQGGQTPRRCGGHLPVGTVDPAADRRGAAGAERRVAAPAPLHAGRGHGRTDPAHHRRRGHVPPVNPDHTQGRMIQGHPTLHRNYTSLTDAIPCCRGM